MVDLMQKNHCDPCKEKGMKMDKLEWDTKEMDCKLILAGWLVLIADEVTYALPEGTGEVCMLTEVDS